VYKGEWHGGECAVKQMNSVGDEKAREQFMNEAMRMTNLRAHSNVVQVFGICIDPLCIVTEYLQDNSLFDLIFVSNVVLDIQQAVWIAKDIA